MGPDSSGSGSGSRRSSEDEDGGFVDVLGCDEGAKGGGEAEAVAGAKPKARAAKKGEEARRRRELRGSRTNRAPRARWLSDGPWLRSRVLAYRLLHGRSHVSSVVSLVSQGGMILGLSLSMVAVSLSVRMHECMHTCTQAGV